MDSFSYHGSTIPSGDFDEEILHQINLPSIPFRRLSEWVFQNKKLRANSYKISIYRAVSSSRAGLNIKPLIDARSVLGDHFRSPHSETPPRPGVKKPGVSFFSTLLRWVGLMIRMLDNWVSKMIPLLEVSLMKVQIFVSWSFQPVS